MNIVEDRLSAALHARAELVQPEDLRAPELPEPETSRGLRPWTYAVLAAACAAAIAVPFVISWDDGGGDGQPTIDPDEGLDWPLSDDRIDHDVDGDGAPDHLTLRVREPGQGVGPARLDVALTTGGTLFQVFDYDAQRWSLRDRVDLDADGDHEIVVPRLTVADPEVGAEVLSLVDGELVAVEVDDSAPFALAPDDQDHARDLWVDVNRGELFSSRSVDAFDLFDGQLVPPDSYQVETWRWGLKGGRLTPRALAEPWCVEPRPGQPPFPQPCAGGIPPIMREVTRTIGVGEIISLGDPIPTLMLRRDGDQVSLDYSFSGLGMAVSLPDRPGVVRAWATTINLGETYGFLVGWGELPTEMAVYAVVDGDLVELPFVADTPRLEKSESYYTFVTESGILYTRENVAVWDQKYRLWSWTMTGEGDDVALAPTDDGIWCLDYIKTTAGRC